jgi:hypothetical protein
MYLLVAMPKNIDPGPRVDKSLIPFVTTNSFVTSTPSGV